MALRTIRIQGDEVLNKRCREVTEMTPRIATLIEDMIETMDHANGVGLAACQVGIGDEGCLSLPGKAGVVTRPNYVKVRALDENMVERELEGTELLARAFCHEIDHLDGHLYTELVEGDLFDVRYEEEEE